MRQFKPAVKIALDIRSRYPWSSFGGIAFHPGIGTATLFALFMPTFAAVLAPFERVVTNAAFHSLERKAATVPFTEKWTGWDLNPRPLPCQDSDLPADLPARDALYWRSAIKVSLRVEVQSFSA